MRWTSHSFHKTLCFTWMNDWRQPIQNWVWLTFWGGKSKWTCHLKENNWQCLLPMIKIDENWNFKWKLVSWNGEGTGDPLQDLAWKLPWMEEPGRLHSMGLLRVGHDWATSLSFSISCIGEGNGNPLQCSCLENPRDRGAWWAAVYGVAQNRTRLTWLSSSSSSILKI